MYHDFFFTHAFFKAFLLKHNLKYFPSTLKAEKKFSSKLFGISSIFLSGFLIYSRKSSGLKVSAVTHIRMIESIDCNLPNVSRSLLYNIFFSN